MVVLNRYQFPWYKKIIIFPLTIVRKKPAEFIWESQCPGSFSNYFQMKKHPGDCHLLFPHEIQVHKIQHYIKFNIILIWSFSDDQQLNYDDELSEATDYSVTESPSTSKRKRQFKHKPRLCLVCCRPYAPKIIIPKAPESPNTKSRNSLTSNQYESFSSNESGKIFTQSIFVRHKYY